MKIGFIGNNDLPGVEADAKFAREHGMEGIEYNYWGGFRELTADTVKQMAAIHQKNGVRCSMFGLWGFNHLSPDPKVRKEALAMLDRAIGFAKTLGADVMVTGGGDIPHEPVGRKVKDFVKTFTPILKKMEKAKLTPAFYAVHGASFFDSLETFERVWEQLPQVKIKYDPANWHHHGDDYLAIPRRYGNKIGHVHIKEHLFMNGHVVSQPAAGMGDIQFPKVLAFLYEHNYKGWLSIEPHGPLWTHGELREKMILISKKYLEQFIV
jgi:sugar phosphate isomerase/epimerase